MVSLHQLHLPLRVLLGTKTDELSPVPVVLTLARKSAAYLTTVAADFAAVMVNGARSATRLAIILWTSSTAARGLTKCG
jgi:hypothetical protein